MIIGPDSTRIARSALPAYVLMLAVLKGTGVVSWRFVLAAMLYIANMAKLVGAQMNEYGSFWSLAVEEQFYLLWPLVVRRFPLHTIAKVCVLIIAASPVLFLAAALGGISFDIRYKLWGNACWLLCSALIAISLRIGLLTQSNIMKITRALAILSAALVPIAAYAELTSRPNSWVRQPSAENVLFFAIMPAYCAAVLYVVASNQKCKGLSTRGPIGNGFAFLGNISYGLYLVNWFVFTKCDAFLEQTSFRVKLHQPAMIFATAIVYAAISIAAAFVSRRYFEERFLQRKLHA